VSHLTPVTAQIAARSRLKRSWWESLLLALFLHALPTLMPRVRAVMWFEAKAKGDWRVNTSNTALKAFRTVAASSLYSGNLGATPARPNPAPRPGKLAH
jgi:hypothetical protein